MMDEVVAILLPTLVLSMFGVLFSCFCWGKHSRTRIHSMSRVQSEDEKMTSYQQLPEDLRKDELREPHPFLPLSLYSGTTKVTTAACGQIDGASKNVGLLDSSYMVSNTCAGVTHNPLPHLLIKQESNSHRNCELPPVPSFQEYQNPDHPTIPSGKQPGPSGSDITGQLLASEPQMSAPPPFRNSQVTPSEALLLRLSISDDPQSESDGLYASVGHSATGCSSVSRDNHLHDSNYGPLRTNKSEEHRQSVTDSAHAPYYSSVVSVVGCPTEYGDVGDLVPQRNQSIPLSTDQPIQHCDLYARVRPRTERLPHQPWTFQDSRVLSSIGDSSSPVAPITSVSQTADSGEPPVPERGYGPSEVEMVRQSRLSSGSNRNLHNPASHSQSGRTADTREHPNVDRSPTSPDSNVPLIRRLLNAIQLINARHYHYSGHASDSGGSRSNQSTTGPYRKITVRESLASLRARNALPVVESLPVTTGPEYERVYGTHGESNSSATYEVVPSRECSNTVFTPDAMVMSGNNAVQESGEGQSKRFSEIYSEIPYTTCYALTFASPIGTSCSTSERACALLDKGAVDVRNTLERRSKSSDPDSVCSDTACRLDRTAPVPATANNGLGTAAFVLAEMQAFRHMDSEVDLTYARVQSTEADSRNSHSCADATAQNQANANNTFQSVDQYNHRAMPHPSSDRYAVESSDSEIPVNETFNNHSLMPPLMERSMEEGSLLGLSHPNTPSISSSAMSNPLNETELVTSLDSDRHAPAIATSLSGPQIHLSRGLAVHEPTTIPQLDQVLPRMSLSATTEWLHASESGSDPVTYDDVALS